MLQSKNNLLSISPFECVSKNIFAICKWNRNCIYLIFILIKKKDCYEIELVFLKLSVVAVSESKMKNQANSYEKNKKYINI